MNSKLIVCLTFLNLFSICQAFSQNNALTDSNSIIRAGDEQGLEIPESIKLEQDKSAIREAISGWWRQSMKTRDTRIAWFNEARFGCFIHWGVYSTLGNEWKGRVGTSYSEHLMRSRRIPLKEYKEQVVPSFNPVDFNAEEWIKAAKDAGMKYFIVTAKHHDGFAMYYSDAYPYDIRLTPFKRDPIKELSEAAKKYGIKFGLYYSHAFDWEHLDAPGNDWDYNNPGGDKLLHGANWWENYPEFLSHAEKYVKEKSLPQVKELIRNYNPDIIWFDTPHKLPLYLNLEILKSIREIAPDIIVNGRQANMQGQRFGDYVNTGDRAAYFRPSATLWEAIPTTNESYGYSKFDHTHKSPTHFIRLLASAAAKSGNILMNVGPMGNGKWDSIDVAILKNIGSWIKVNGESIYGTSGNPLSLQSWGEITQKGNRLYLHVFQWPKDGKLILGGFDAVSEKAWLLSNPSSKPLKTKKIYQNDLQIEVPSIAPDSANTVIVLDFSGTLKNSTERLISSSINNKLLVFDAKVEGEGINYGDGKRNREYISNWINTDQVIEWNFRLNEAADMSIMLSYNTAAKDHTGEIIFEVDGKQFTLPYSASDGDNPLSIGPGKLHFEKGVHKIRLIPGKYQGSQLMRPLYLMLNPLK